jgi:squalene-hopene/tetraprenyl-beta-curcumene cyclase
LHDRVAAAFGTARDALLAERTAAGWWEGELSTSALSTATAVMALEMVRRSDGNAAPASLIDGGLAWIAAHQNADGGWGDTTRSFSNISTTMLCHAVFHATATVDRYAAVVAAGKAWIDRAGGVPALRARYGTDKTFSIPILTHCALAGLVEWREIAPLPFELACIPARLYKWARLPVVSYALPALIAMGQVRHHFRKPGNPVTRFVRRLARDRSLAILQRIQPSSGGFLEAAPLTSFVTMSLAGMGLADHPVARQGVQFLLRSVRPDGSWPIDTNLATWVTTLSVNALGPSLPRDAIAPIRRWLLGQQYQVEHPYTNADPGGWAWTDLPGGVPDADDTPGAILAIVGLQILLGSSDKPAGKESELTLEAIGRGARWLLGLQNSDAGWPTFCRGWGALPFDRSAPDLTAHAIRAFVAILKFERELRDNASRATLIFALERAIDRGFKYLARAQRADGSWLPLWFGNQRADDDENPTYGTARVLAAYRDADRVAEPTCQRGVAWLRRAQNPDGGWGGAPGVISSIEETALAVEVLLSLAGNTDPVPDETIRGLLWLLDHTNNGKLMEPSPIGFYFAKLWYFEKLYPLIFTVAAFRRAMETSGGMPGVES